MHSTLKSSEKQSATRFFRVPPQVEKVSATKFTIGTSDEEEEEDDSDDIIRTDEEVRLCKALSLMHNDEYQFFSASVPT